MLRMLYIVLCEFKVLGKHLFVIGERKISLQFWTAWGKIPFDIYGKKLIRKKWAPCYREKIRTNPAGSVKHEEPFIEEDKIRKKISRFIHRRFFHLKFYLFWYTNRGDMAIRLKILFIIIIRFVIAIVGSKKKIKEEGF